MGACASRPKDLDLKEGDAPTEAPTPKKVDEVKEDSKEGDETKSEKKEEIEEPLVDFSKPKEEEKTEEPFELVVAVAKVAIEIEEPIGQPSEARVSEDKSDE